MPPALLHYFQSTARNAHRSDGLSHLAGPGDTWLQTLFHVELGCCAPTLLQRPETKAWLPSFQGEAWGFGKLLSSLAKL